MKSNKIFPSLFIALSALFASCSKDGSQPTSEGKSQGTQKISFSAELPEPATDEDAARTTLAGDGHKVNWTLRDRISVFAASQTTAKPFDATQVIGNEATFEGEGSGNPSGNYFAIYPHSTSNSLNQVSGTFTTNLATDQPALLGSYADNISISVAKLENATETNRRFKFRNATGLLKIEFSLAPTLAGKQITEIVLRANPDASGTRPKLSGAASVTVGTANARPTTTIASTGLSRIRLSNGGAAIAPTAGGKGYYMVVPTQNTGSSFSLVFLASDGSGVEKKFNISTPFSSNKIKTIKVNIDKLEQKILRNVPLIDAIDKNIATKFVREADRTIDYFKNIEALDQPATLNETANTALTSLDELEYYLGLTSINLVNMAGLTGAVDIKTNTNLASFTLTNTGISSVTVSGKPKLTTFTLTRNANLTSIKFDQDVSSTLKTISATFNPKLVTADVLKNTQVQNLNLNNNAIGGVWDLSNNPDLRVLNLGLNTGGITSVNTSRNPLLTTLSLSGAHITTMDVSNNKALVNLNLTDTRVTSIPGHNDLPRLLFFMIKGASMTSVDISKSTLLTNIEVSQNRLTTLDITKNTNLMASRFVSALFGNQKNNGTITVRMTSTLQTRYNTNFATQPDNRLRLNIVVP